MAHISVSGEPRTPIGSHAPPDMPIVVGFGRAKTTKDGELFFDGEKSWDIKQLEEIEAKSPPNLVGAVSWMLLCGVGAQ